MADDGSKRPGLIVTFWILAVVSGMMMGLRLYCKVWRSRGLWWDDYTMLLSWMALVTGVGFGTVMVLRGFGGHLWAIGPDDIVVVNFMTLLVTIFSVVATSVSKTSFALTLCRLSSDVYLQGILVFIIVSVNVLMNAIWVAALAMCAPTESVTNSKIPGECWSSPVLFKLSLASSFYSAVLDFILAILPWVILKDMTLSTRERLGVCLAMSLAALAGGIAMAKTFMVFHMSSADYTYSRVNLVVLAFAEPAISIVAMSIPVLRTLYRGIKTRRRSEFGSKSSQAPLRQPTFSSWTSVQGPSSRRSTLGNLWKYGHHSVIVSAGRQGSVAPLDSGSESRRQSTKIVIPPRGVMKTEEIVVRHENRYSRGDSIAAVTTASSAIEKSW
ncbi:unnamed protein product [Clonostachys byssicola]|uniref:Rhodopsin domain-containing protein n=1 Tax=Clonostachys byssicola TaxID=160290 RepID=A0A9N9UCM6_9HYPO|nr:unnamed protein product [Clonostachys byssicola]